MKCEEDEELQEDGSVAVHHRNIHSLTREML